MSSTKNLRVSGVRPLLSPALLDEEIPTTGGVARTVNEARLTVQRILSGEDDRLLVVVGPCSIHDPHAALAYAGRLKQAREVFARELVIVMRVYFEKPRTTVGWKGLINDPHLDSSYDINTGLRIARHLLHQLNALGVPCGCEFLNPISPQFISDLVSWGAIGARTTESQVHRELASGLSMPIGFKNGTDGRVKIAVEAALASGSPHHFLGVTEQGLAAIVATAGNRDCHVVLRGGSGGPNFDAESVAEAASALGQAGLRSAVMVDCSHDNSQRDYRRQPEVAAAVARQVERGQRSLIGVMLESNLVAGNQKLVRKSDLVFGQSITDGCMSWEMTESVLHRLADAVGCRRRLARAEREASLEGSRSGSRFPGRGRCLSAAAARDSHEADEPAMEEHEVDCKVLVADLDRVL